MLETVLTYKIQIINQDIYLISMYRNDFDLMNVRKGFIYHTQTEIDLRERNVGLWPTIMP